MTNEKLGMSIREFPPRSSRTTKNIAADFQQGREKWTPETGQCVK